MLIFVSLCFPPILFLTTSCASHSSKVHLMLFVGSWSSWQSNLFSARSSIGFPLFSFMTFSSSAVSFSVAVFFAVFLGSLRHTSPLLRSPAFLWVQLTPTGDTPPSQRSFQGMVQPGAAGLVAVGLFLFLLQGKGVGEIFLRTGTRPRTSC